MSAAEDFRALCDAPSLSGAIRRLHYERLANLIQYLKGATGGVRALVLGAAQIDAADRFVTDHAKTEQAS